MALAYDTKTKYEMQRTAIDRTGKPDLALTWNGQYQLTSVSTNGVVAESYAYDPFGRRASTTAGGVTIRHVYDGAHCAADTDAAGILLRSYTWGLGIDNLLAVTCHDGGVATTYYALTDIQGTVHGFADADGDRFETCAYDAWGNVLAVRDGNGLPIPNQQSQIQNRFLFQGREYSWATGLYNFRLRWYDPATGRWLSKDPIGISGGLNLYAFCGNDPVNYVDPWGLVEEGEATLRNLRVFIDAERIAAERSGWAPEGFVIALGAFALHGGHPWSPLDTKVNNPYQVYNVPGRGMMQADEFGNYLAGYHAGYSSVRGTYTGMRIGGFIFSAGSNAFKPILSLFFEDVPTEHWSDRDSVPAINAGYEDGVRDRKNKNLRGR